MRVLHVIPAVAPRYGGPSSVIVALVAALNRIPGVTAEVATTDADGPSGRLSSAELPEGVKVHLFRRNYSEQWKYSAGLRRWLWDHVKEYDLLHLHALWSYPTTMAARLARRFGVPYILRPAGMLSAYTWARRSWQKRLYWQLVERKTILGAAAFHATSEEEAQEIRAVRADATVVVIPNGVEDQAFTTATSPDVLRTHCGPAAVGKPIILFLSRLHPKKGVIDLLLPAVARLRHEACLAIVGGEDEHALGYATTIRETINRLELGHRVVLLGPCQPTERWAMFDGADVFVLPSWSENFGIVVGEAMARGCPVVVTETVQSAIHVRTAGAGRVVPFAIEPLAAALDELLADPATRLQMSNAGRLYAAHKLTWTRAANEVNELYSSIIGQRTPRTCSL